MKLVGTFKSYSTCPIKETIHSPHRYSSRGQVQCLEAEKEQLQACTVVELLNVGLIYMVLLEMTMQKVHLCKVNLKKAQLLSL